MHLVHPPDPCPDPEAYQHASHSACEAPRRMYVCTYVRMYILCNKDDPDPGTRPAEWVRKAYRVPLDPDQSPPHVPHLQASFPDARYQATNSQTSPGRWRWRNSCAACGRLRGSPKIRGGSQTGRWSSRWSASDVSVRYRGDPRLYPASSMGLPHVG